MDWKTNISYQLKDYKQQCNIYDEIIIHYNRLLESNAVLLTQNGKLENDVQHLRLANAGLEKASEASQSLANVNDKLNVANEELMVHLREKGELAREVLRLNHSLTETNEKLANEEKKAEQYKNENDLLTNKLDKSEAEVNELVQINVTLREEFTAVQIQFDQLQTDYTKIHPTLLELQQQLDKEKRINKGLEEKLLESKKVQLEMLEAELKRQDDRRLQPQLQPQPQPRQRSDTIESDRTSTSSMTDIERPSASSDESSAQQRRNTTASSSGGNIFSNFKKIFNPGMQAPTSDNLNRTSTFCVAASIPTREVTHWDCTELEVYAIQFQPSGSLLATGCSDKLVHLWEISSSGQPRKYCSLQGSHGAINAVDFDHEGSRLLAGCSGEKAYIWSYADRMRKDILNGHEKPIYCCKFISGTKLATGSADRLIKIWDLKTGHCIRTLCAGSKCHDLIVKDAAGTVISGHFDKKIRIWDTYVDQCRTELQYNAIITSLSYNAEKNLLLTCLRDDTLQLIDLRQNRVINTLSNDNFQVSTDTTKAVLSPDGRYACAGSHDGSIVVWNTTNGVCESVLTGKHNTMVTSVSWHPEGRYVASCEKQRRVILWTD